MYVSLRWRKRFEIQTGLVRRLLCHDTREIHFTRGRSPGLPGDFCAFENAGRMPGLTCNARRNLATVGLISGAIKITPACKWTIAGTIDVTGRNSRVYHSCDRVANIGYDRVNKSASTAEKNDKCLVFACKLPPYKLLYKKMRTVTIQDTTVAIYSIVEKRSRNYT